MRAKMFNNLINNNKKYYVTNVSLKFLLTFSRYLNSFCKKKKKETKMNVALVFLAQSRSE